MKHKTILVLGDWSDDGHGKTAFVSIESNRTKRQLQRAYEAGCGILGWDPCQDVCCEYEQTGIDAEMAERLKRELGFDAGNDDYLDEEDFVDIWTRVVKKGDDEATVDVVPCSSDRIAIGGYGLFS